MIHLFSKYIYSMPLKCLCVSFSSDSFVFLTTTSVSFLISCSLIIYRNIFLTLIKISIIRESFLFKKQQQTDVNNINLLNIDTIKTDVRSPFPLLFREKTNDKIDRFFFFRKRIIKIKF